MSSDQGPLRAALTARMDARPDPASPALCGAPFVAMEFDAFGNVQACCANALYPLGNVTRASLHDIWTGKRATALRQAIMARDLSYGCQVCRYRWTFADGEVPRDYYDEFPIDSVVPDWPQLLCLSLHNTCNLECIMCGADASSRIRTRRAGLAPLPHVYGDRFFDELRPFLAHAVAVDIVGGEPFLVREHQRVWDLLRELEVQPKLSLTTNGTIWNPLVEQILRDFDISICVSVDGVTPETFERVRVGASFDEVMENLGRFERYAAERGTTVHLSFSMVKENWFELGAVLLLAEERNMGVSVQTVIEPEFGVQRLPTPELEHVLRTLEAEDRTLAPKLHLNRDAWDRQLERLRDELAERRSGVVRPPLMEPPSPANAGRVAASILRVAATDPILGHGGGDALERARRDLEAWSDSGAVGSFVVDPAGTVRVADLDRLLPWPADLDTRSVGRSVAELLDELAAVAAAPMWIGDEFEQSDRLEHTVWFGGANRDKHGLQVRLISVRVDAGICVLVAIDTQMLAADGGGAPVAIARRS